MYSLITYLTILPLVSLSLAISSSPTQRRICFLLLSGIVCLALYEEASSNSTDLMVWSYGAATIHGLLVALDHLVLTPDPLAALQPKSKLQFESGATVPKFSSGREKFVSYFMGVHSFRRLGLVTQIRNIPPFTEPREPVAFIRSRLVWLVPQVLLAPICQSIFLAYRFDIPEWHLPIGRYLSHILARAFVTYAGGCFGYVANNAASDAAAIAFVALGFSRPEEWPQYFGSLKHATTLRGFWGKTWHQQCRRPFTSFSNAVAQRILGLPVNSLLSSYVHLWVAFALSAFLHAGGDYVLTQGHLWPSVRFFLLQPLAIVFENAVISLWKRMGMRYRWQKTARFVGYVWVNVWFIATFPILLEGFASAVRRREAGR